MNPLTRFLSPSPIIFFMSVTLGFSWLVFGCALFGIFTPFIIMPLVCLLLLAFITVFVQLINTRDWHRVGLLLFLIVLALSISLSRDPSIFSGRDQGSIAEAAYRLATTHELTFSSPVVRAFFDIYGPGTALNFPGFAYTENGSLLTQFPIGYTSFIAAFIIPLGLLGYAIANSLLFLLFGWSFFELLLLFTSKGTAFGGALLGTVSFLPFWMLTYTLSENLAIVLFVFLALSFLALLKNPLPRTMFTLLATVSLFPFVRIEGFAFFALVIGFILWKHELRELLFRFPKKYLIGGMLAWIFLFLRDFFINLPFYKMIGKALLRRLNEGVSLGDSVIGTGAEGLGLIFSHYGLLILFVSAIIAAIYLFQTKQRFPLWMLMLVAPTSIYLLVPSITPDHPWMLRRFYFSLYPAALFLVVVATFVWSTAKSNFRFTSPQKVALILGILVALQIGPALSVIRNSENTHLLADTKSFSTQFGANDLILLDRESSGDPYSMLGGPLSFLYGKQAVYFFNPFDLERLNRNDFTKTYLLTPEESLGRYTEALGEKLIPLETVSFTTSKFITPRSLFALPTVQTRESVNVLFEIAP